MKKPQFLNYQQASKISIDAGITTASGYYSWSDRPVNLPANPAITYGGSNEINGTWVNWYDFLGKRKKNHGKAQMTPKGFVSYKAASKMTVEAGVSTAQEYFSWEQRPQSLPSSPSVTYKKKGWVDWYHFLGKQRGLTVRSGKTSRIAKKFLSYEKACVVVAKSGIKTAAEYLKWRERPSNIPFMPNNTYSGRGWDGWKKYLCQDLVSLELLSELIKSHGIQTKKELGESVLVELYNIPANLSLYYSKQGYTTFRDLTDSRFLSYEGAKAYIKKNHPHITNSTKWKQWDLRPAYIPYDPVKTYSDDWGGWSDFL